MSPGTSAAFGRDNAQGSGLLPSPASSQESNVAEAKTAQPHDESDQSSSESDSEDEKEEIAAPRTKRPRSTSRQQAPQKYIGGVNKAGNIQRIFTKAFGAIQKVIRADKKKRATEITRAQGRNDEDNAEIKEINGALKAMSKQTLQFLQKQNHLKSYATSRITEITAQVNAIEKGVRGSKAVVTKLEKDAKGDDGKLKKTLNTSIANLSNQVTEALKQDKLDEDNKRKQNMMRMMSSFNCF